MNEIKEYTKKVFEDIKHIDEFGNEFWLGRELQNVLGYHQWRSINDLIERAKDTCKEGKHNIDDHFAVQRKMIKLAKGAKRNVIDYKLSRYACYLIVMNGNPKKRSNSIRSNLLCHSNKKSSIGQMTNNIKNIDLPCFQGLIKRTTFYIKPKEDVDSDYNLEILISINI